MSNYQTIIDRAELAVDKNVSSDMLHAIIELYTSVRSYSYANDIDQKYKAKCKVHKAKSLRKEIKRSAEHSKESEDDKLCLITHWIKLVLIPVYQNRMFLELPQYLSTQN